MNSRDWFLYLSTVLIWGSTWLAITFQLGPVPVEVSIAYRFALAAGLLLAYCVAFRIRLRFPLRAHRWMVLQGLLLFAVNYVLTYHAERFIGSGLAAVGFTSIVFLNIVGMRVFFGKPVRAPMLAGAALGTLGIALVFWPELAAWSRSDNGWQGLLLILGSAAVASLGNMVAVRNQFHGFPVVPSNAYGMAYGAILVAMAAAFSGRSFSIELTPAYLLSLAYLSLFGSVLAFGAYVSLLGRIGADKAGYVSVLFPLVALGLSTWFEGFVWHGTTMVGVISSMAGNVIILREHPRTDPEGGRKIKPASPLSKVGAD